MKIKAATLAAAVALLAASPATAMETAAKCQSEDHFAELMENEEFAKALEYAEFIELLRYGMKHCNLPLTEGLILKRSVKVYGWAEGEAGLCMNNARPVFERRFDELGGRDALTCVKAGQTNLSSD